VIQWQSPRYDGKMRHGVVPLTGMRPDEFIYFASYVLSGLVLTFSSFLFILLEPYGLQLQHLSLHSITLVAIFVHLYEMYVCVWLSMCLFWSFHMLCSSRRNLAPPRWLLLLALDQGSINVHHRP
jgi:hypothetical protein